MCIRDRFTRFEGAGLDGVIAKRAEAAYQPGVRAMLKIKHCLLYTSDAADERSSVDLGGRRIIKKKTRHDTA